MEQNLAWSQDFAVRVGQRVARLRSRLDGREGRKFTTQALADRTAQLGHPLDRSVIAKLEKGHRQSISVPELLVLAEALEVPPLLLLLPLGHAETVEILPGTEVPVAAALRWLTGERPLPGSRWEGLSTEDGSPTVAAFQTHQRYVDGSVNLRQNARRVREGTLGPQYTEDHAVQFARDADNWEAQLRNLRVMMRGRGLTPPPLPPELAHIEGGPKA